ncbi:hypothetical protein GCM10027085_45060 [Spirosoma aerophilum]
MRNTVKFNYKGTQHTEVDRIRSPPLNLCEFCAFVVRFFCFSSYEKQTITAHKLDFDLAYAIHII